MKIGIVGAGGIAARHLQALSQFEGVEVVAVASPSLDKAQALSAKCTPTTRSYTRFQELLKRETLDALYICVPPFAHGELELAAIEKKIPFFVEKPLSADRDTAAKIAEEVAKNGLVTAVGYQWRYLNTTELAQKLVGEKPARMIIGNWLDSLPPPDWWSVESLSGGQVVEQTTHLVDLARLLVGEIKEVYALGGKFPRQDKTQPQVDTASVVSVQFENGSIGTFNSTCLLEHFYRKGLQLFGDGIAMELGYQELSIDEGQAQRRIEVVTVDPFILENRDFLEAVTGKSNRVRVDYAEAMRTHRVTQAIQRSIQEGKPVTLAKE